LLLVENLHGTKRERGRRDLPLCHVKLKLNMLEEQLLFAMKD